MNTILPLPSILNEESFDPFPSREDFVAAIRLLAKVVGKLRMYGFSAQLGCSSAIFSKICYADVTFLEWLRMPNGADVEETEARKYVRLAISKTPRLEEGYASFYEHPDFDLLWQGKLIYINPEKTLPAFVVAYCFQIPTIALSSAVFKNSFSHRIVIRELEGDATRDYPKDVCSFADIVQVDSSDGMLRDLICLAVVDTDGFLKAKTGMFPNLIFSHEVETALSRHRVDFRSIPVIMRLMRLQNAIQRMTAENIDFEEAYGRISSLAMNESASVRNRIPDTRRFTWDDGYRVCFPHVKIGNSFRIHFLPDKNAGKVYVGFMGHHLPL